MKPTDLARTRIASSWQLDDHFPYPLIEDIVSISKHLFLPKPDSDSEKLLSFLHITSQCRHTS